MTDTTKRRAGRPAKRLKTWPHPWKKYAHQITLMQGIQPGNDYIYADFFDDDEGKPKRLTKNPVSLGTKDKAEAEEGAVEKLGAIKADIRNNIATGRQPKHLFGTYAKRVINKLIEEAAAHGITRPGKFRARLLGESVAGKAASPKARALLRAANKTLSDQAIKEGKRPDKGNSPLVKAYQIEAYLLPKWQDVPIGTMTSKAVNQWVRDELRLRNGPRKGELPTVNTLVSIDTNLGLIWKEAVADGAVDEDRRRPKIDKNLGAVGRTPTFFRDHEIAALARHCEREWEAAPFEQRLVYLFTGMMTCAAMRPGLEILDTRIGYVRAQEQHDLNLKQRRDVHSVQVLPNAGKYPKSRIVTVFKGPALHFDVIRMLTDVITHWKAVLPPRDFLRAGLFGPEYGGKSENFSKACVAIFRELGILTDPQTGLQRRPYDLRHYFATKQIEAGVDTYILAKWMGTSVRMIEKHYDHYLLANDGWKIDGYRPDAAE